MRHRPLLLPLLLAASALAPSPLRAQVFEGQPRPLEDGRLPVRGQIWFQASPRFQSWRDEFADGSRVPLSSDLAGPLASRLYPGPDPLVSSLNADADALGYDSVTAAGLALGSLDFGTLERNIRSGDLTLQAGVLDRLAVEVSVPLVATESSASFAFDTTGATFAPASIALPTSANVLAGLGQARDALQAQVDGGGLSPAQQSEAETLLQSSGRFLDALGARTAGDFLLPLAGSPAGTQLVARYADLGTSFGDFGLSLPELALAATAGGALPAFLASAPVGLEGLSGSTRRGFSLGEIALGARIGILGAYGKGGEEAWSRGGFHARTTLGGRIRIPTRGGGPAAYHDPAAPLELPVADGQKDLEATLYQDLRAGAFELHAFLRYGRQRPGQVKLRVHTSDRPLGLADQEATLEWDPGDYTVLRASPRVHLAEALTVGLDYLHWHEAADRFTLIGAGPDPAPLSAGTGQTLNRLGFGAFYEIPRVTTSRGGHRPGRHIPFALGLVYQRAVSGSGGRVAAAQIFQLQLRVPAQIF